MKNLNIILIPIQHIFQVGNAENHKLNYTSVDFEFRDAAEWIDLVGSTEKDTQLSYLLKTKIKNKLLNFENEVTIF